MTGTRYLFYVIFLTMLSNVMILVPHVLIQHRFEGAMMSVLLAVPIGILLFYVFTKSMVLFPGLTLSDILANFFPKWFRALYVLQLIIAFFWAGAEPLLAMVRITKGFLNPEMSQYVILLLYLGFVLYTAAMQTTKLLYTVEAILMFVSPLILFILGRSVLDKSFSWVDITDIATNIFHPPDYSSVAAATYIFSGYFNLVVLNRSIQVQLKKRYVLVITVLGIGTLLTSFLIPIGLLGKDAVSDFVFPWISATDTLRLEYSFIERVMLLFIMLYLFLVLLHTAVVWHVAYMLSKSFIKKEIKVFNGLILLLFAIGAFLMRKAITNDYVGFQWITTFLNVRFAAEIILAAILIYAARRQKKA